MFVFQLVAAALAGAALSAAICLILWKSRMRKLAAAPTFAPPPELTEWDRRFMAYHEAGHAVCSRCLPELPPLLRITISPSDEAFGMVRTAQSKNHNETRRSMCSTLAVLLAGRLAEELFLHETTTSGIHDFAAAGQLAADMVCKFGMGKTTGFAVPPPDFPVSDEQLRMINADIRQLVLDAETEAREVLSANRGTVEKLAALLLGEGTLDVGKIDRFFSDAG
jgi:cell division protease FtsH